MAGYPDYFRELGLDPGESREVNLKKLNARYDRIRNQSSDAARVEQAILKQAQKIFSNEASYREYLDSRFSEENTSARNAEAEIRRQEAEKRKELERKLERERIRANEAVRQAHEAEQQAQQRAEKQPSGFWDTLLKGAAEAGVELLKNRITGKEQPNSGAERQTYNHETTDLNGDWRSPDGLLHRIWHNGNQVRVQAINPFGIVVMDGIGTFDGRYLRASYQTGPAPTIFGYIPIVGEAHCEVSDDGRSILGQASNHTLGQVFPINLYR